MCCIIMYRTRNDTYFYKPLYLCSILRGILGRTAHPARDLWDPYTTDRHCHCSAGQPHNAGTGSGNLSKDIENLQSKQEGFWSAIDLCFTVCEFISVKQFWSLITGLIWLQLKSLSWSLHMANTWIPWNVFLIKNEQIQQNKFRFH